MRVVATRRGSQNDDVVPGVPDDPEGILSVNDIDTDTIYEMRRRGVTLAPDSYTLDWPGNDDRTSLDTRFASILVVLTLLGISAFSVDVTQKDSRFRKQSSPVAAPVSRPSIELLDPATAGMDSIDAPSLRWSSLQPGDRLVDL
ncbi:hypothetical protein BH09PSE6_BH09PSE6_03720 [soil metagenome]